MWLQLWVSILQIKPVGIFLKVYIVNIRFWSMCISQRRSNLVTPVCLVPGEISEDVWVQGTVQVPLFWVGDLHGKLLQFWAGAER